jgi:hypothetical protein
MNAIGPDALTDGTSLKHSTGVGFIEILNLFAVRRSVPHKEDRMP